MGFLGGVADYAQIGPGAILGVRASGNHGTRGVAQPTPGRIRNRCGRPVSVLRAQGAEAGGPAVGLLTERLGQDGPQGSGRARRNETEEHPRRLRSEERERTDRWVRLVGGGTRVTRAGERVGRCREVGRGEGRRWAAVFRGLGWGREVAAGPGEKGSGPWFAGLSGKGGP